MIVPESNKAQQWNKRSEGSHILKGTVLLIAKQLGLKNATRSPSPPPHSQ